MTSQKFGSVESRCESRRVYFDCEIKTTRGSVITTRNSERGLGEVDNNQLM